MAEDQNRTWNDRYMLRMPDGMRDRIKAAAEANNRSMNSEIVARLEASLEGSSGETEELARQAVRAALEMLQEAGALDVSKISKALKPTPSHD